MIRPDNKQLAGIECSGLPGVSKECQDAVMRLLQFRDRITMARILSCSGDHCLLLTVNDGDLIAIKSGFASGYLGEGPRRFSYTLALLDIHGVDIEEYEVDAGMIERLDSSSLTASDIDTLDAARPVRPTRLWNYIADQHDQARRDGTLWEDFDPVIPFAIIDSRLTDLAVSFWEGPDDKLLTAYRRLEDIVRTRTGVAEHGAKLFSQAFLGPDAKLEWENLNPSEQAGRCSLFTGAYQAHRNPRAHRESKEDANDQLAEFLLLNHLYLLEKTSRNRSVARV